MCFEKPHFMLLFETHVASEHHRHTITDTRREDNSWS